MVVGVVSRESTCFVQDSQHRAVPYASVVCAYYTELVHDNRRRGWSCGVSVGVQRMTGWLSQRR